MAPEPPSGPASEADAIEVSRALKLDGFFPEFSAELCGKVFPRSRVLFYDGGERLMEQGEAGRDLLIVLDGTVSVSMSLGSAGTELAQLGVGALLGEKGLLRDGVRGATVCAVTPVRVFRLAFGDLGYLLKNNPELAAHLQELLRQRSS